MAGMDLVMASMAHGFEVIKAERVLWVLCVALVKPHDMVDVFGWCIFSVSKAFLAEWMPGQV